MEISLLERISDQLNKSRGAEHKVFDWIISNQNQVLDMSITQLAKSCEVSEATVIRACQTLDFNGYRDFRIALAMDISSHKSGVTKNTERIYFDDKPDTIIHKIFNIYQQTLQLSLENCNVSIFEQAIEKLIYAHNVLVFSGGTQVGIAEYFVYRFIETGIICTTMNDALNQRNAVSVIMPNDVLVVINHSGCLKSLVESAEIAQKRGATIIGITSFSDSPLGQISDLLLQTFGKDLVYIGEKGSFAGMTSKVTQIAMIDCLVAGISMRCPDTIIPNMESCIRNKENLFSGGNTTRNVKAKK